MGPDQIMLLITDYAFELLSLLVVVALILFLLRQPLTAWINAHNIKKGGTNGLNGTTVTIQSLKEAITEMKAEAKEAHNRSNANLLAINDRLARLETQVESTKQCIKDIFSQLDEMQKQIAILQARDAQYSQR